MVKRVTIIGSESFIGKNLHLVLKSFGYDVNFLTSRVQTDHLLKKGSISKTLHLIKGNNVILSGWPINDDLKSTLRWCDHIFIILKEFLLKNEKNYLICLGSAAELNPSNETPIKEEDFNLGVGDYGKGKVYLLKKFLSDKDLSKKQYSWIRLFAPTGKYESPMRLLPSITKMAMDNQTIFCNNPNIYRDFYDVNEAIKCIKFILEKKYSGIINLGSGKNIMIKDLIEIIIQTTYSKSKIIFKEVEELPWKKASWFPNIEKLKRLVPIYPKKNIEEIIKIHIQLIDKN